MKKETREATTMSLHKQRRRGKRAAAVAGATTQAVQQAGAAARLLRVLMSEPQPQTR